VTKCRHFATFGASAQRLINGKMSRSKEWDEEKKVKIKNRRLNYVTSIKKVQQPELVTKHVQ